ncbi:glycoside hydrolase superfamily [Mycena floridula]|nr:glycoside hydrolase superfamily [Mycena floridula]
MLWANRSPEFLPFGLGTHPRTFRCFASDINSTTVVLRQAALPKLVGAAANTTFLFHDANYTKVIDSQASILLFSIFTPENEMKWETIEPFQNTFNFAPADEILIFAEALAAKIHGHTFMWANQLAPWVNSSLSATELDRALENHINTVLDHFKGRLYAFDIINEMISDSPSAISIFKDNIWTQKFGESAMPKALTYARKADPSIEIVPSINDYGIEGIGPKSNALFQLVQSFQKDGIPLDGIGFQCHFGLGQVPADLQENLQRFADLGLEVAITELDINLRGPGNATSLAQQATDYHMVVSACKAVDSCVSVTVWGISDDHSWISGGNPLPWDAVKSPKPAFFAMADAFEGK